MIRAVAQSVAILAIVALMLYGSPGRVVAQPTDTWLVMTFKLQFVEGRRVMQLLGPFPSAATCEGALRIGLESINRQGIDVTSSACRTDVTVVVPD